MNIGREKNQLAFFCSWIKEQFSTTWEDSNKVAAMCVCSSILCVARKLHYSKTFGKENFGRENIEYEGVKRGHYDNNSISFCQLAAGWKQRMPMTVARWWERVSTYLDCMLAHAPHPPISLHSLCVSLATRTNFLLHSPKQIEKFPRLKQEERSSSGRRKSRSKLDENFKFMKFYTPQS